MIKQKGFSLIEVVVSLAIMSMVLLFIFSFFWWMNFYNSQANGDTQALDNARTALDQITYEIRGAESVYTPTTTSSQLSLQTARYLPAGETYTYIDFFLCGNAICFKKESQAPVMITSSQVSVSNLVFNQMANGSYPSVQVSLTVNGVTLNSTASIRQ